MRPTATIGADRAQAATAGYLAELHDIAAAGGVTHSGVAPAAPLLRARRELRRRAAAGLADDMAFTYRNPERSTDPQAAVADAQAIFVGALPYGAATPDRPDGVSGRIARYAWDDVTDRLREAMWDVARRLRADGWKAVAFADDNSIVDREVAHLAGIGWFGKNANLMLPGAGSWFVLGCVVTTAPLPVAEAVVDDGCGACARCLDRCPTQAIVEPGVVDARRCLSWLLQKPGSIAPHWREAIGDRLYGCDECQDSCPPTVRFGRRPELHVEPSAAFVDVVALLRATDDEVLERWGRRYLADRDPRWARRNALVVLGNTPAAAGDPDAVAVLRAYLEHPDETLREHAAWAARAPRCDVKHLLVTNDFPPKIGGIQSLLWEWWRRLPPESCAVLTSPYAGAGEFDRAQPFHIERVREPALLPHPWMVARIDEMSARVGADFVVLDPAFPLGLVGPSLRLPYDVILHGAEVTVPGRLPVTRPLLGNVLRNARQIIAGGNYPAAEAEHAAGRTLPSVIVPPGVDIERFVPLEDAARHAARERFGLPTDAELVVSISRLVPRKGFDTAIRAAALLRRRRPDLMLAISGGGRDEARLRRLAKELGAPVRFLGRVPNDDLPALYACADVYAMVCRNRWGGLEQEGFGIVFLEAAACGVPQVAGASGGAAEAVADGETGIVVRRPEDAREVAAAFTRLLDDPAAARRMGQAGRRRAVAEFSYDVLAERLGRSLGALP